MKVRNVCLQVLALCQIYMCKLGNGDLGLERDQKEKGNLLTAIDQHQFFLSIGEKWEATTGSITFIFCDKRDICA